MSKFWVRWPRILAAVGLMEVSLFWAGCSKAPAPPTTFSLPVLAAEVLIQDRTNFVEYVGQTLSGQDVEIRARVAGFLKSVNFTEGKAVRSNDLLYVIDDQPFKVALSQAEGGLAQTQAALEKARLDTNRLGPLWLKNAISRQQYDDALAAERAAAANVQAAQAAVEAARIQLDYTVIRSPIDGLVGKSEVGAGNLVGQGQSTLLTTVSDISSISVQFSVSEQTYLGFRRRHNESQSGVGIFELILADGSLHPHRNSSVFADRRVDPKTGTLLLQVQFPNPDKIVRPGQFARVRFPAEIIPGAVIVPQRCMQDLQGVSSVFVVGPQNRAEFRKIVPGPRLGTLQIVRDGLKPGDKVVVDGIQKLQNGAPMSVTLTNFTGGTAVPL